jgi:AcrR family transcriptional regulator
MSTMTPVLERHAALPRRRNAELTRAAILEAAKVQFAQLGYDRAVLRDIAGTAGVDVALVKRYFGGKEALFVEALKAAFLPEGMPSWNRASFARDMAHHRAAAQCAVAGSLSCADPELAGRRRRGCPGSGAGGHLHRLPG